MALDKLMEQLSSLNKEGKPALPPVDLWDPAYCGEIDLQIKSDGSWFYNGTPFKRIALVKLFASVLKREGDEYFLVTPVEKVKIQVDDCPFVLSQWEWSDDTNTTMAVATNLDDAFLLDLQHPVILNDDGTLEVTVRRNLTAKVHRNVYYQWVDLAKENNVDGKPAMTFTSGEQTINLGFI